MPELNSRERMNRREFVQQTGVAGGASAFLPGLSWLGKTGDVSDEGEKGGPNIIFLLTDDQRWDALGCMGNPIIQTPNLDRLAGQGVLFTNAFVTTSICAPNRACILSGQHMRTHGIRDFATPFSPEALDRTYPIVLKRAGYRIGFIGKWGVGAGRDEDLELPASKFDYWRGFKQQGQFFHEVDGEKRHLTRIIADQAREFLEGCSSDRPFCLSISFKAPHGPWQDYDPAFEHLYEDVEIPVAETATQEIFDSLPQFVRESLGGRAGGVQPERIRRLTRQYYRLITGVDVAVGKIVEALRDLGFDDNTVVILTSDNGHFLHEHGLHGKWLMYEESIRVPMMFYDPRAPKDLRGTRRTEMALTIDIAPTILSLCGTPVPDEMQGSDLTPLLAGKEVPWREDFFYEHTFSLAPPNTIPKTQGVRTKRWKYVRYIDQSPHYEQLFDLRNDPQELRNLAGHPEHAEVLQHLRERYQHYREVLPNTNPDLAEYPEYKVVRLSDQPHTKAWDFAGVESLGQTFRAEGGRVHSVSFATPTWFKPKGPADLIVELFAGGPGGKLLTKGRVAKDAISDNKVNEVRFDSAVEKGKTVYLRVRPASEVPEQSVGWWGYEGDVYPLGTAYVDDEPQPFDFELTVIFKDE